ncbi:MXAN_6640 family putative metalloprotease [Nocardioides sp.]|uniref:MXAN_6640 family putative metalloprotease n=1 Tax=Nocardioides sp. TaxID=35761 RepID=UPI003565098C
MRRTLAAAVAAGLALSIAPASVLHASSSSAEDRAATSGREAGQAARPEAALAALTRAEQLLGTGPSLTARRRTPLDPDEVTLALRDLFVALPALEGEERKRANGVLARPTDNADDPYGDGYPAKAKTRRQCEGHFCLHWVREGKDAPPGAGWRKKTLQTMNQVWKREVDQLGYRPPLKDGRRGGDSTFDVYLKDLGSRGFYGYCAPERRKPGSKWRASGYCVLDNDFSREQYHARPIEALRVTAAHEFFHAIQFGYDYGEDPWFMEATATWIEERFADGVNDNRQYLPFGQLADPATPLDTHRESGFNQYGNWPFFEFLSSHFGPKIVRTIWNKAATFPGAPDHYSVDAVAAALGRYGGLPGVLAAYSGANTAPALSYAEGRHWPKAPPARRWTLGSGNARRAARVTIDHLAARSALVLPGETLGGRRWRLRIDVDVPVARTGPAVYVLVQRRNAAPIRRLVRLEGRQGRTTVGFSAREVRSVTVTLVNASTRYRCWVKARFSCQGEPRDDGRPFRLRVRAFKR